MEMSDNHVVDARGLACPQPVLLTKKILDEAALHVFTVLVDNETAKENVSRFARNQGCVVHVREQDAGHASLTVTRGMARAPEEPEELLACPVPEGKAENQTKTVVYVASRAMGTGSEELGRKLMRGFFRTWIDVQPAPWRVILINSGVFLSTVDEEAADALAMLEQKGVHVLSCGTCLQHFGLEQELRAGKSTNMYEVIESLNQASKVVSPD
jgi:selenium metabolism protein YedF